eukprot:GHVQ01036011.1.p2 GENE.GHVQ01036011.1~~GHVQ01036011.1.p2  ORF type:complete len:107 (+),score=16.33 GHVQ01036011.1:268-588(+)
MKSADIMGSEETELPNLILRETEDGSDERQNKRPRVACIHCLRRLQLLRRCKQNSTRKAVSSEAEQNGFGGNDDPCKSEIKPFFRVYENAERWKQSADNCSELYMC